MHRLSIRKRAPLHHTGRERVDALALKLAVFHLSFIDVAVRERVHAISILNETRVSNKVKKAPKRRDAAYHEAIFVLPRVAVSFQRGKSANAVSLPRLELPIVLALFGDEAAPSLEQVVLPGASVHAAVVRIVIHTVAVR